MLYYIAKTSLGVEYVKDKIKRGCDGLEIQLLQDWTIKPKEKKEIEKILENANDVVGIHTPLLYSDDNPEWLCNIVTAPYVAEIFELADYCAKKYKHRVYVLFHNNAPSKWDTERIYPTIKAYLDKYKDVDIVLENITPVRTEAEGLVFANGCLTEAHKLVKYYNDKYGEKRFYTCLDTCHLTITNRVAEALGLTDRTKSLETCLEEMKDSLKVIHIADAKNFSFNKGEHGLVIDEEMAKRILQTIKELKIEPYLVLEVVEEDYTRSVNFEKELKILKKVEREEHNGL